MNRDLIILLRTHDFAFSSVRVAFDEELGDTVASPGPITSRTSIAVSLDSIASTTQRRASVMSNGSTSATLATVTAQQKSLPAIIQGQFNCPRFGLIMPGTDVYA